MMTSSNDSEKDRIHSTTDSYGDVLRKYYFGSKYIISMEGVLKVICFVLCVVSVVIYIVHDVCANFRILVIAFPIGMGIGMLMIVILYVGTLTRCSQSLPELWLYIDIILSTAAAVISLILAILVLSICSDDVVDLVPGLVGILTSILLIVSIGATYVSSIILWNKIENQTQLNK